MPVRELTESAELLSEAQTFREACEQEEDVLVFREKEEGLRCLIRKARKAGLSQKEFAEFDQIILPIVQQVRTERAKRSGSGIA